MKKTKFILTTFLILIFTTIGYFGTISAEKNIWTKEYAVKHGDTPDPTTKSKINVNIKNKDGEVVYKTNMKYFEENTALIELDTGFYFGSKENDKYFKQGKFKNKPNGSNGNPDWNFLKKIKEDKLNK